MPFLPESIRPTWVTKKFAQADQRPRADVARETGKADNVLIKTAEENGLALYDHLGLARPVSLDANNNSKNAKKKGGR